MLGVRLCPVVRGPCLSCVPLWLLLAVSVPMCSRACVCVGSGQGPCLCVCDCPRCCLHVTLCLRGAACRWMAERVCWAGPVCVTLCARMIMFECVSASHVDAWSHGDGVRVCA